MVSFCSTRLMNQLNCEGKRRKLTLNTMGEKYTMYTHEVKNLQVCDLNQEYTISLPVMYTKDEIASVKTAHPNIRGSQEMASPTRGGATTN